MDPRPIYLDYQATTPVDPRVREAMLPFLKDEFGNPHSTNHAYGWEASDAVKAARAQVAHLINADDNEIVFTSGATESCNLALRGVARGSDGTRNRIITVVTEHPAVLETVKDLGQSGYKTVILPVGSPCVRPRGHGRIRPRSVATTRYRTGVENRAESGSLGQLFLLHPIMDAPEVGYSLEEAVDAVGETSLLWK